jgi:hypothetical protein
MSPAVLQPLLAVNPVSYLCQLRGLQIGTQAGTHFEGLQQGPAVLILALAPRAVRVYHFHH